MSLGIGINNALSGLLASQQSIAVISQNIANANNEDYSRQEVRQASVSTGGQIGSGVIVEEITRTVDEFINRTVISRGSDAGRVGVINDSYEQSQILFGAPGQGNSIDTFVSNFFDQLRTLESSPEQPSLKFNAVNSGVTLASEVSNLARGIEELRFGADQAIDESVSNVNFNLRRLQDLNASVLSAATTGNSANVLLDEVDSTLKAISEEINISFIFDNDGAVSVSTSEGIPLLQGGALYQLEYTPLSSVEDLIEGLPSSAITVSFQNDDGTLDSENGFLLSSGGVRDGVESSIESGKIKGYQELRDTLLPNILEQIDELSETITIEVNRLHNDGVSFPPPNSLTGTTFIDPNQREVFSGSVTIQALDPVGLPLSSPYNSQTQGFQPLTIDLGALSDADGSAGNPSFQTIIDEINDHFGAPAPRVGFNDINGDTLINNIQLVSQSNSLTPGVSTFQFSVETNNLTGTDQNFRILSATPSDAGIVVSGLPASTTDLVSSSGGTSIDPNTGNISLNLFGAGAGPYSIDLEVETTDLDGNVFTETITYNLPVNTDGLNRDRIAASGIVGGATGGVLELPNTSQSYLTARLVDSEGNEVARDASTGEYTEGGFLQITGTGANTFGIAELDSSHNGSDFTGEDATGFGFSHFLGLNNLFVDDGETQGSAIEFAVRQDIIDEPGKISTAQLTASPEGSNSPFTFEVSNGNNQSIGNLADLVLSAVSVDAAGGLPRASLSISSFAAEILGFNAAVAADASEDARTERLISQGFEDRNNSVRGVNIDEELANTIIFQNAFSANARVITVVGELFDTLIDAAR